MASFPSARRFEQLMRFRFQRTIPVWSSGLTCPPFLLFYEEPLKHTALRISFSFILLTMLSSRLTQTCLRQASMLKRGFAGSSAKRSMSSFLEAYDEHVAERAAMANGFGVAPKPLDATQASSVIQELKEDGSNDRLLELLVHRVPPGVDEAAYVKATWLSALAKGVESHPQISRIHAIELLGTMQGGYNVGTLVELLKDPDAAIAKGFERTRRKAVRPRGQALPRRVLSVRGISANDAHHARRR